MGLSIGDWKTALIDISESTTLSAEVDLGSEFEDLLVLVPTITSSTVTVHVAKESGGTFYPLHILDDDATGSFASASTAATTSIALLFKIGGIRYIKIACGSAQETTDKTFYVRGINPK